MIRGPKVEQRTRGDTGSCTKASRAHHLPSQIQQCKLVRCAVGGARIGLGEATPIAMSAGGLASLAGTCVAIQFRRLRPEYLVNRRGAAVEERLQLPVRLAALDELLLGG